MRTVCDSKNNSTQCWKVDYDVDYSGVISYQWGVEVMSEGLSGKSSRSLSESSESTLVIKNLPEQPIPDVVLLAG